MNRLVSIVVVEDDAVIRAVLEMALQAEGFSKVSGYARGDEGLSAIRRLKAVSANPRRCQVRA